jgi:UDP-glucose 4-epimerase
MNLANALGYSVREVVAAAEHVCGKSIRIEMAPRRAGDPPVLIGNPERAQRLLGWRPARSELSVSNRGRLELDENK